MNKVILMGRLTRDPEVRYSTSGDGQLAIARYTLAVDRRFKRDGEQSADFIRCVAFGRSGEFAEKYFHQGTKIVAEGRIQTGSYQDKDGKTVYTTEVVVENQEFAESKAASDNAGFQAQQMMAQDRKIVEEAYAGDIIGVFDPGIFSIGDTLCTGEKVEFEGIPTFAPEHFARVRQMDTMKRKQFIKGISQIAQEGAIQIFQEFNTGMEEIIVGVVGVLQFEVLTYRLENEYNVEVKLEKLPYEYIRWVENADEIDVAKIQGTSDMKRIKDLKDNPLLLFVNSWSVGMVEERNPKLKLSEFGRN